MLEVYLLKKGPKFLITVVNKKVNNEYKGFTANLVKEAFNWNDNFMKN